MESKLASRCTAVLIGLLIFLSSYAVGQTAQPNRIVRPVDNRSVVRLQGTLHPLARSASDQGPASPTQPMQRMTLFFQPTAEQQSALDQLLAEQQDPTSPNYHKWLTPEEFADRFGISSQDISVLAAWLRSQGFTVDETARSRTWIAFSGIAAQVNAAFQTSMHNYLVNGKVHYAAAIEPSVPAAFAGVVTGIGALHNFAPHARSVQAKPRLTSSLTGNHFIVPGDFAAIYDLQTLYNNGINGTGQTIAIMGQTDLTTDSNPGRNGTPGANGQQYDVVTFRNLAGLPALTSSNFQTVLVTGVTDPGVVTADANEANLDVEWSGAVAPNANLVYVIDNPTTSNGAFGSLEWAVSNVKANVFSISYGECEPQASADKSAITTAAAQAAVQGQTIVAPSGDSGAADCDSNSPATQGIAVDFPASIPTVTAVGGTEFSADSANNADPSVATPYWAASTNDTTASALAYIPETAWNDFSITTPSLSATGGGVSTFFPQPTWQAGIGSPTGRGVPDISFTASAEHDGYLVCSQASCVNGYRDATTSFNVIGGTSAPTPSFAGIVALINQKMGANQGNINPVLYAQATSAPWAFHDITTGNNMVACTGGTGCVNGTLGYSAGPGYDLVTGLGSLDVDVLLNAMTGVSDFSVTPSFPNPAAQNITLTTGSSGTLALTVLGTVGSNITFTCTPVAPLTATTCTAPSPVTANGGTAVSSTLSVSTTSGYSETGAVNVTASNGSISHLVPVTVVVNGNLPDFQTRFYKRQRNRYAGRFHHRHYRSYLTEWFFWQRQPLVRGNRWPVLWPFLLVESSFGNPQLVNRCHQHADGERVLIRNDRCDHHHGHQHSQRCNAYPHASASRVSHAQFQLVLLRRLDRAFERPDRDRDHYRRSHVGLFRHCRPHLLLDVYPRRNHLQPLAYHGGWQRRHLHPHDQRSRSDRHASRRATAVFASRSRWLRDIRFRARDGVHYETQAHGPRQRLMVEQPARPRAARDPLGYGCLRRRWQQRRWFRSNSAKRLGDRHRRQRKPDDQRLHSRHYQLTETTVRATPPRRARTAY